MLTSVSHLSNTTTPNEATAVVRRDSRCVIAEVVRTFETNGAEATFSYGPRS